jgi:hypothetical protein
VGCPSAQGRIKVRSEPRFQRDGAGLERERERTNLKCRPPGGERARTGYPHRIWVLRRGGREWGDNSASPIFLAYNNSPLSNIVSRHARAMVSKRRLKRTRIGTVSSTDSPRQPHLTSVTSNNEEGDEHYVCVNRTDPPF